MSVVHVVIQKSASLLLLGISLGVADARSLALLASGPSALVLADAPSFAILALAPSALVLAEAPSFAILACFPDALVIAVAVLEECAGSSPCDLSPGARFHPGGLSWDGNGLFPLCQGVRRHDIIHSRPSFVALSLLRLGMLRDCGAFHDRTGAPGTIGIAHRHLGSLAVVALALHHSLCRPFRFCAPACSFLTARVCISV